MGATLCYEVSKESVCFNRLVSIQLQSLYCRRQRGDLIDAFKILNDFTNVQIGTAFTLNTTQFTRGHPFKVVKSRCNLELRRHFFTNCVVNQWNSLPSYVVCAPTVNSFKSKLDNYWNSIRTDMDKIKGLWPINN